MSTTIIIFVILTILTYFFNIQEKLKKFCEKKVFLKTEGEELSSDDVEEKLSPIIINEDSSSKSLTMEKEIIKYFEDFNNEYDRKEYVQDVINNKGIIVENTMIDLISSIKLEYDEFMKNNFNEYESEETSVSLSINRPKKAFNFLDDEEPNSDEYL